MPPHVRAQVPNMNPPTLTRPSTVRRGMRAFALVLLLAVVGVQVVIVFAAAHTITYTAAQDSLIQTKLIPAFNRLKCASYGKPNGCSSADLVAGGCVVQDMCDVLGFNQTSSACVNTDDMKTNSCTIFAADTVGQDALMREALNSAYASTYSLSETQASQDFKTAFDTAPPASQQAACTAVGLPASCAGP